MLKLETPWDDDEDGDEDKPHRPEEDDDTVPDEDDRGEDDDEDDEEPLRTRGSQCQLRYCSPITATVIVAVTSVCSTISIGTSPTCLSGPCGMRTCERSTSWPCFSSASTMS